MAEREVKAVPAGDFEGAPLIPTGDPMADGVGPASWASRADVPDLTAHGQPKVVPMRVATTFTFEPRDPNPIGLPVQACDGEVAGTIVDAWVDRSEPQVRYYETQLADGSRRVLVPAGFVQWPNFGLWGNDHVKVKALTAKLFAGVPAPARDDQITMLEEEKIMAYFAGGHLYATEARSQPVL